MSRTALGGMCKFIFLEALILPSNVLKLYLLRYSGSLTMNYGNIVKIGDDPISVCIGQAVEKFRKNFLTTGF